eukprot:TCONS_00069101-protein
MSFGRILRFSFLLLYYQNYNLKCIVNGIGNGKTIEKYAQRGVPFRLECDFDEGDHLVYFDKVDPKTSEELHPGTWVNPYNRLYTYKRTNIARLDVARPTLEHEGHYRCKTQRNNFTAGFNVQIKYEVGNYKKEQAFFTNTKKNQISIGITGTQPQVAWFKYDKAGTKKKEIANSNSVSNSSKYYVDITNGNLMVNDIKKNDTGTFEYLLTKKPYNPKTDKIKVILQEKTEVLIPRFKIVVEDK